MSFVRWGDDSDVYIYGSQDGIICQECQLMPTVKTPVRNYRGKRTGQMTDVHGDFVAVTVDAMLEHITSHRRAGHKVPAYADENLRAGGAGNERVAL